MLTLSYGELCRTIVIVKVSVYDKYLIEYGKWQYGAEVLSTRYLKVNKWVNRMVNKQRRNNKFYLQKREEYDIINVQFK